MMESEIRMAINKETEMFTFRGITLTRSEMQSLVNLFEAYKHFKNKDAVDLSKVGNMETMKG